MNFDDIKLRRIHIYGRDVLQGYLPDEPEDSFNRTQGWNSDHHDNPVRAAVMCMNAWMRLNQFTLWDTYDQCGAGVSVSRKKRNV